MCLPLRKSSNTPTLVLEILWSFKKTAILTKGVQVFVQKVKTANLKKGLFLSSLPSN